MRTEIAIDPNVRVHGNGTYAGFEDILRGNLPSVGDDVVVREPESDLVGVGQITEIDVPRSLVYLSVDWSSLRPRQHADIASESSLPAGAGRGVHAGRAGHRQP